MKSEPKQSGAGFWDWLADNTARVQSGLKRSSKRIEQEIARRFEKSYPDLGWEVTICDDEPWLFCVTANGNRELFPRVQQVARETPEIKGWRIQAFRPRGVLDVEISMDGQKLDYDDIWCKVEKSSKGLNLVLHIRGVTVETEETLSKMAFVLLDNAIGEYDAAMKIADVDLALMEEGPKASDSFFPLRDLPAFLDRIQG